MLDLLKYIVNQFAEDKEHVSYEVNETDRMTEFVVTLSVSDMGKIIGRQGKIAKAIRTLVRASAPKDGKRYTVEFRERETGASDTDSGDGE